MCAGPIAGRALWQTTSRFASAFLSLYAPFELLVSAHVRLFALFLPLASLVFGLRVLAAGVCEDLQLRTFLIN